MAFGSGFDLWSWEKRTGKRFVFLDVLGFGERLVNAKQHYGIMVIQALVYVKYMCFIDP